MKPSQVREPCSSGHRFDSLGSVRGSQTTGPFVLKLARLGVLAWSHLSILSSCGLLVFRVAGMGVNSTQSLCVSQAVEVGHSSISHLT